MQMHHLLHIILSQKMMNTMIIIKEEKRYSVTNLDDSILEVKINKLDEQRTEKREQ